MNSEKMENRSKTVKRLLYLPWVVVVIYLGYGALKGELTLPPVRGNSLELMGTQIWVVILSVLIALAAQAIEIENVGISKLWKKLAYYFLNVVAVCVFFYSIVFLGT